MKLTIVKNNNTKKQYYNCSFQAKSNASHLTNKVFNTLSEMLIFAMTQSNDRYIISINDDIYDWIKKNDHPILKCKNYQFV